MKWNTDSIIVFILFFIHHAELFRKVKLQEICLKFEEIQKKIDNFYGETFHVPAVEVRLPYIPLQKIVNFKL